MLNRLPPPTVDPDSRLIGPARWLLTALLDRTREPVVVVEDGVATTRGRDVADERTPTVTLADPRTWPLVAREGSAGLGEAYFRGWWTTDDLLELLRRLIRNSATLDGWRNRWAARSSPLTVPVRRLRRPDPARDRVDIAYHYDLSNDFFELLLGGSNTYSCALFEHPEATLAEAQEAKLERWCQLLGIDDRHDVVEIGGGWGTFAAHAAATRGARVTTTTVSAAQHDHAQRMLRERGLDELVDLRDVDYRELDGRHDRLVSIEMIEAVDWREHDTFFATCERLLRPDGLAGIQAIVIADQRYERAKHTVDFIRRWIFPGGVLPSITALTTSITRATELRLVHLRDIGVHYATTLAAWRANLLAARTRLGELGLDDEFVRLFEMYLVYCEAAFRERHVSVVQMVLAGPDWRGPLAAPG